MKAKNFAEKCDSALEYSKLEYIYPDGHSPEIAVFGAFRGIDKHINKISTIYQQITNNWAASEFL